MPPPASTMRLYKTGQSGFVQVVPLSCPMAAESCCGDPLHRFRRVIRSSMTMGARIRSERSVEEISFEPYLCRIQHGPFRISEILPSAAAKRDHVVFGT